jgi:hypothetical protein
MIKTCFSTKKRNRGCFFDKEEKLRKYTVEVHSGSGFQPLKFGEILGYTQWKYIVEAASSRLNAEKYWDTHSEVHSGSGFQPLKCGEIRET